MLNYKHLHYFYSVAKAGGIHRASERLHLTPQTISGQISQFEKRLGVALFHRVGQRLVMTDAGRLTYSYAQELFQVGSELENALKQGDKERAVHLRVGIADVVPKFLAHRLLAPLLETKDPTRIVCREAGLETLLSELALHRLDFVIADRPMPAGTEIKGYSHLLGESHLALMASPLLIKKLHGNFPQNLNGAPLLLPSKDSALAISLPRWLDSHGLTMKLVGEFDDSALMKAFGEAGAGVFPVPAASIHDITKHYKVRCLGEAGDIAMRYFFISTERKLANPLTKALHANAQARLFPKSKKK